MIKSIETYCSPYLEKFKKSVILKSGIYQTLFHTVTLMEFASFGFEPTGIAQPHNFTFDPRDESYETTFNSFRG